MDLAINKNLVKRNDGVYETASDMLSWKRDEKAFLKLLTLNPIECEFYCVPFEFIYKCFIVAKKMPVMKVDTSGFMVGYTKYYVKNRVKNNFLVKKDWSEVLKSWSLNHHTHKNLKLEIQPDPIKATLCEWLQEK